MKKIAMILAVGLLTLTACSKEKKVNKRLDGSWNMTAENGVAPEKGSSLVLEFNKDKKEGEGVSTYTDSKGNVTTTTFSYTLDNNVLTTSNGSYTVTTYTKDNLTLVSTNGTLETTQEFERND